MTTIPDLLWPSVLAGLPTQARRILDLGVGLQDALQRLLPQGLVPPLPPGCEVHRPDDLAELHAGYDLVLLGPMLGQGHAPQDLLAHLHEHTAAEATVCCVLPNAAHHSVIERFMLGDLMTDAGGLLPPQAGHLHAPTSTMKLMLDAGWLPRLIDHAATNLPESVPMARLLGTQQAMGLRRSLAERQLTMAWMVISASKLHSQVQPQGPFTPLSVIVPVRHETRFELNAARSPGLQEVQAELIAVPAGASAAQAWAAGRAQASHPWCLMLSEDHYLPQGSGLALSQHLARLEAQGRTTAPVGLAGLQAELDLRTGLCFAGQWSDGDTAHAHHTSAQAVALHDGAVALHRDSPLAIDDALGWHLWATDLCLQTIKHSGGETWATVCAAPLWVNADAQALPHAILSACSERLLSRHPEWHRIPTLHGELSRG